MLKLKEFYEFSQTMKALMQLVLRYFNRRNFILGEAFVNKSSAKEKKCEFSQRVKT